MAENLDKQMIEETRQGEAITLTGEVKFKNCNLESYGCAMNFADSEVVASILSKRRIYNYKRN